MFQHFSCISQHRASCLVTLSLLCYPLSSVQHSVDWRQFQKVTSLPKCGFHWEFLWYWQVICLSGKSLSNGFSIVLPAQSAQSAVTSVLSRDWKHFHQVTSSPCVACLVSCVLTPEDRGQFHQITSLESSSTVTRSHSIGHWLASLCKDLQWLRLGIGIGHVFLPTWVKALSLNCGDIFSWYRVIQWHTIDNQMRLSDSLAEWHIPVSPSDSLSVDEDELVGVERWGDTGWTDGSKKRDANASVCPLFCLHTIVAGHTG